MSHQEAGERNGGDEMIGQGSNEKKASWMIHRIYIEGVYDL